VDLDPFLINELDAEEAEKLERQRRKAMGFLHQTSQPLFVPEEFHALGDDRFRWARGGGVEGALTATEQTALWKVLKPFARAMFGGVKLSLLLGPGRGTVQVCGFLDEELTELVLAGFASQPGASGVERRLPLGTIKQVLVENEIASDAKGLCTELQFTDGRFVRFCFETQEQCDYFGVCMKILTVAIPRTEDGGI